MKSNNLVKYQKIDPTIKQKKNNVLLYLGKNQKPAGFIKFFLLYFLETVIIIKITKAP